LDVDAEEAVFFINSLGGGGAESVCVNLANYLTEKGWSVSLVVLHLNNAALLDRLSDKVVLHNLNVMHGRYALLAIRKYLNTYQPKVVLAFNYSIAVLLVIARFLFRQPFKIIARNINTFSHEVDL